MGRRASKPSAQRVDVLLVCSSGGHLLQLTSLRPAWEGMRTAWVSFDKSDVRSLLRDERVYVAHGPTNRSIKNLLRNLVLSWRVVALTRPRVLITTGAGVAVPFAYVARLLGARVVVVESFTRIDSVSLTCRLLRPIADRVYVQWPEMLELVPEAVHAGNVFSQEHS